MTTAPSTIVKPLEFQDDRGPLSQDSLYHDMGFQFILAPNRYRKLAGKTPREMPEDDYAAMSVETAIVKAFEEQNKIAFNGIDSFVDYAASLDVPKPTMSAGTRLLFLNLDDQLRVQQEAIKMMQHDWPDHAHLIHGYETHINMFDEILIWRKE